MSDSASPGASSSLPFEQWAEGIEDPAGFRLIGREEDPLSKRRALKMTDARVLCGGLFSRAWGVSPSMVVRASSAFPLKMSRSGRKRFIAGLDAYFGTGDQRRFHSITDRYEAANARALMVYSLEKRQSNWRPDFEVKGFEQVQGALARGRGVIIWCEGFVSHVHVQKRALSELGLPLHHVSVPTHGYPDTGFAARFLHPTQVMVENRYLTERIVFDPKKKERVGRRVEDVLSCNGVVLITNNVFSGRRFVEVPFGAEGHLRLAAGPALLARKTGAALLPVATIEQQPLASYTVRIGCELAPNGPEAPGPFLFEVMRRYRDWLDPLLHACPEQWKHWQRMAFIHRTEDERPS